MQQSAKKSTANKKKTLLDFKEINVSKDMEVLKMTKKYYAEHCLYGVNTSYDSFNRHAYSFFVFDSKKERDEWVDKNAYDPYGKLVAAPTKLKNVRYCMGRNFIVHGHIIVHSVDALYE